MRPKLPSVGMLSTAVLCLAACRVASVENENVQRVRMVREQIEARGVTNATVLAAMGRVLRHEFVPEKYRSLAYADGPLPIGHDQTISQPYIVALMTDLLQIKPGAKVLEVGTGSGYQAAVLAELGADVYTIEIIEPLATAAVERLKRLGYRKVQVKFGDGYAGWKEHAPFDAIVVTAAADPVPPPLVEQLKRGGRLVIPVGGPDEIQTLVLLVKDAAGQVQRQDIIPVAFVPLTRGDKRSR